MEKMDLGGGNFETVNGNNKKLYRALEKLISQMDLSYGQLAILAEPDFSQPQKLKESVIAAKSLSIVATDLIWFLFTMDVDLVPRTSKCCSFKGIRRV